MEVNLLYNTGLAHTAAIFISIIGCKSAPFL